MYTRIIEWKLNLKVIHEKYFLVFLFSGSMKTFLHLLNFHLLIILIVFWNFYAYYNIGESSKCWRADWTISYKKWQVFLNIPKYRFSLNSSSKFKRLFDCKYSIKWKSKIIVSFLVNWEPRAFLVTAKVKIYVTDTHLHYKSSNL